MSASLDLRTILNLLPRLARLDGRPVAEACAELELGRDALLALIQSASALAWGGRDEGELVDIWEEGGRLRVHTGGLFEQVVRLLPPELLALRLGAAQLAAAGLAGDLDLDGLLARIEEGLAGGGPDVAERVRRQVGAQADPALEPALLERVLAAAAECRLLRLWYYSRNSDRLRPRVVEPWLPFQENGIWYLRAWDRDLGAERMFRLDRVVELAALDESFPAPPPDRLSRPRLPQDEEGPRAVVRLRGQLARMAREEGWPGARPEGEAAVLEIPYDEADPLLRYLLAWAPDAAVEDPVLRPRWLALLDEMRERHTAAAPAPPAAS